MMSICSLEHSSTPLEPRHRGLSGALLLAAVVVLGFKFQAIGRVNINWDEFWFLSLVHTSLRNELTIVLQGAYVHLFAWLPAMGPNEIDQIVAARFLMTVLLALSTWLIWQLGRLWFDGVAAAAPCFVYIAAVPVLNHGGSFRADSLVTPLLMYAILQLSTSVRPSRREAIAGIALGIAAAITIKIVLFAPLVLSLLAASAFSPSLRGEQNLSPWRRLGDSGLRLGLAAPGAASRARPRNAGNDDHAE